MYTRRSLSQLASVCRFISWCAVSPFWGTHFPHYLVNHILSFHLHRNLASICRNQMKIRYTHMQNRSKAFGMWPPKADRPVPLLIVILAVAWPALSGTCEHWKLKLTSYLKNICLEGLRDTMYRRCWFDSGTMSLLSLVYLTGMRPASSSAKHVLLFVLDSQQQL
jgi:hypothetical protein